MEVRDVTPAFWEIVKNAPELTVEGLARSGGCEKPSKEVRDVAARMVGGLPFVDESRTDRLADKLQALISADAKTRSVALRHAK